jgi:hypothetical protein
MTTPGAIFAADPGKTSGWATWDGERIESGQAEPMALCERLTQWIPRHCALGALVVYESYIITAATAQKSQQPWSLELIGAARWICHDTGQPFELQKPADAKRFVTDARLKHLGLWVPGEDHARDALRHLVLALAKRRLIRISASV